jgi:hypothetical protein
VHRGLLGGIRLLIAALILAAIAAQLVRGLDEPPVSVVEFVSFFTIESNLIAAGVLIAAGTMALRGERGERVDDWRGAATLYMAITGVVYTALLSGDDSPLLPWANAVLHYVAPVWMVADWALDRPARPIPFDRVAGAWMAFPTAFFFYTLIRGEIADWYPYPFLDVADNGYVAVLITGAVLGLGMLGLIWLLTRTTARESQPAG